MMRYCLMVKAGLAEELAFPFDNRMTIGRQSSNDILLLDPKVSRQHAVVYIKEGQVIVEDLSSQNGTFVNGRPVKRTTLSNGDILRVGNVDLQFLQRAEAPPKLGLAETQQLNEPSISKMAAGSDRLRRSQRLIQALSRTPLFSRLDKESIAQISQAAQLLLANRGKSIIKQGDRDRSMYIILDGKVRVLTQNNQGKQVHLGFLSENQFFGEISLLTGAPRTDTVQAVEETLLCKLGLEVMQELFERFPLVKTKLERYYRVRLKEAEEKKLGTASRSDQGPHVNI